jgi:hypothetical protein
VSRRLRAFAHIRSRAFRPAAAIGLALVIAGCGGGPTPSGAIDGSALAASFVGILGDPTLHASVVQQATATSDQGGEPLDFRTSMSGDLALPDVDLEVAVEAEGSATRFRVIVVGDRSFVDLGEGWVEAPPGSVDTSELTQALVVVSDPADLEYLGPVEVAGRTLQHLAAIRPLPYSPSSLAGDTAGTGTIDDLDAYVEADGTPVRISFSFTAEQPTDSGSTSTTLGTSEILFSNVGGDQVIVPPSPAPSLAPTLTPTASPATAP